MPNEQTKEKKRTLFKPQKRSARVSKGIFELAFETLGHNLTKRNFKGPQEVELGEGLTKVLDVWANNKVEYLVERRLVDKPSVSMLTHKVLVVVLRYAIEKLLIQGDTGKLYVEFRLGDLLLDLGYTHDEIYKGGKRISQVLNSIRTLGATIYRFTRKSKKPGMVERIQNNFFGLYEILPEKKMRHLENGDLSKYAGKDMIIRITINDPYDEECKKLALDVGSSYILLDSDVITDRNINGDNLIYRFLLNILFTRGGKVYPHLIRNLLDRIGVNGRYIKEQPAECFNQLKRCLAIIPRWKHLVSAVKFGNKDNRKSQKFYADDMTLFTGPDFKYEDFKTAVLEPLDIDDIRECFIAFYQDEHLSLDTPKNSNGSEFLNQLLEWIHQNIPYEDLDEFTMKGTDDFVRNVCKRKGEFLIQQLFQKEIAKDEPNALRFVSKTLGGIMRSK